MTKLTRSATHHHKRKMNEVIDLLHEASSSHTLYGIEKICSEYVCPRCESSLSEFIDNAVPKMNPFAGPTVICNNQHCHFVCDTFLNMAELKKIKRSMLPPGHNQDEQPHIEFVDNTNEINPFNIHNYTPPDPDGESYEEHMKHQGFHITEERIEYPGSNTTVIKKDEGSRVKSHKSNLEQRYLERR